MINIDNSIVKQDIKNIVAFSGINWRKLKNKTVLITGASGMLASYITYTLMYLNNVYGYHIHVVATARHMKKPQIIFNNFLNNDLFELLQQDVVEDFNYDGNIDYIVHAAGNASPKYILTDPVGIINANVRGTSNLLELAKNKKISNFLFLSTREVYGKVPSSSDKVSENTFGPLDCLESRSCYPESKRLAETMLISYANQFEVPFNIARIAHSYGPGMSIDKDGRIMSDLISNTVNKENILLKSDGNAERAFSYISDTVTALFLILLNGSRNEAYNVANEDEPTKIKDVAEMLISEFPQFKMKLVFDIPEKPSKGYSKMGRVPLDTAKIDSLGWKRFVSLREGLRRTVDSFLVEE